MTPIIPKIEINGIWHEMPDYRFLSDNVLAAKPKCVVEIGAYKGISAVTIASSMPESAHLWCVDCWLISNEVECEKRFAKHDLRDRVTLISLRSLLAAAIWDGPPIDFLHIDGADSAEETYSDIIMWMPHLADRAFVLGHDWHLPGVKAGVERVTREHLFEDGSFGHTNHQWGDFSVRFSGELQQVLPQQWYARFNRQAIKESGDGD